ncbi:MAG: actin-binding protein [Bdellovibrio sp.]
MATATFRKILDNLSETKGIQSLLESFQKLNDEIKKKESELKNQFDKQKEEKIELAWKKYQEIVKTLGTSEAKLEKEVNSTLNKIKKSADDLEKSISSYKKKAIAQKTRLEKALFKKTMKKKAAAKKTTTKKVAKKVVRKATKKASRKA